MNPLTVASHTFEIKNEGHAPLTIYGGESSCKCTLSDLDKAVIQPGSKHSITLTWNSGHAKREFMQTAMVHTDDPLNEEIQLSVSGMVRAVVAVTPDEIVFGRLSPESGQALKFVLYSQLWDDMIVDRIETSSEHFVGEVSDTGYEAMIAMDDEIKNATSAKVIELTYDGESAAGSVNGHVRIFVRPPADWQPDSIGMDRDDLEKTEEGAQDENELEEISYPTQEDGTVLHEIPFAGYVVRRLSLYGGILDAPSQAINLGKLQPRDCKGANWAIVGRVRGSKKPDAMSVEVTGIPGLVGRVVETEAKEGEFAFRIELELTEKLQPAIYNREQAGKLRLTAKGMPPGDDLVEFDVNLSVYKP